MNVEVREVDPSDLDAYFDVRSQAFARPRSGRTDWIRRMEHDRALLFGAYVGGEFVGGLRLIVAGQWMLGRAVSAGAIAAVVVRPEQRGRGVARSLLHHALDAMRDRDVAVSVLHPASTRVYRSAGWEIAGDHGVMRVPTRSLAAIAVRSDRIVERLGPPDWPAVRACYDRIAPSVHGYLHRSEEFWSLREPDSDEDSYTYGVRSGTELLGYVRYRQSPISDWEGYLLTVDECISDDHEVAAALWQFVGAHGIQVEHVAVPAFHEDHLVLMLAEQDLRTVEINRWMHRIVDLPGAIASRGFSPDAHGEVTVQVDDPWPDGLTGAWTIEVENGEGAARPSLVPRGQRGTIHLDIGALSALSIGRFTASELLAAGRLNGDVDVAHRLERMLAAPRPKIADEF